MSDRLEKVLELYGRYDYGMTGSLPFLNGDSSSRPDYGGTLYPFVVGLSEDHEAAEQLQDLRKNAVRDLTDAVTEESLWAAVVAFQGYSFRTMSGLPFLYKLNVGRNGKYTKELIIDRRKNSKSLSWSSVVLAFQAAKKRSGSLVARPKDLGDIRGISYIFSMFSCWGLISVPESYKRRMQPMRQSKE